jgi:hypothetical protein
VIGDVAAVRARGRAAGRWLEADDHTPFLAHAALEPARGDHGLGARRPP